MSARLRAERLYARTQPGLIQNLPYESFVPRIAKHTFTFSPPIHDNVFTGVYLPSLTSSAKQSSVYFELVTSGTRVIAVVWWIDCHPVEQWTLWISQARILSFFFFFSTLDVRRREPAFARSIVSSGEAPVSDMQFVHFPFLGRVSPPRSYFSAGAVECLEGLVLCGFLACIDARHRNGRSKFRRSTFRASSRKQHEDL